MLCSLLQSFTGQDSASCVLLSAETPQVRDDFIAALGLDAVFAADSVLHGAGLNLAVATMQVGETAMVHVASDYGYGTKGKALLKIFLSFLQFKQTAFHSVSHIIYFDTDIQFKYVLHCVRLWLFI